MKRLRTLLGLLTVAMCFLLTGGHGHAATELLVYTSIEPDRLPLYKKQFEDAHPDIRITWMRDSTGVITARLLAEKDAPKADVVFGVGASSLLVLHSQGMLESYRPKDFDKLAPAMRDPANSPVWLGMDAWASAICVNKPEMAKRGLPIPQSWEDLARPEYAGLIAMPDPASSGTGFMNLTAWIQLWGEEAAWAYAEKLHSNVKTYTHSGTKPCVMAAQGEAPIGVSSGAFIENLLKRRAPIAVVLPVEGLGWEVEASALMKGSTKKEAAKALLNWTASEDVARLGAAFSGLPARPEFVREDAKSTASALCKNDLQWAADNRERLLTQWRQRFSPK